MPLPPGQKLGPYEILGALGAGGMGEVYRARDSKLGRDVALKVLPQEVTADPVRLERFDREARAIAALNHPHIVTIYSTEEIDGTRFITMELVEGRTLDGWLIKDGRTLKSFFEVAIPLADALTAAHQKQITHRDLKPGNVMVSNEGRVKVLDFGLARVGDTEVPGHSAVATRAPITHQGMIVGTMPYMSPEQVEGRQLDPRSDLFSLGVMFYEMLSGERPFGGSSSPALMSSILRDTPSSISDLRSEVPEPLARLVSRLLEKRPEDRVQTARDVYNELRHQERSFNDSSNVRANVRANDRANDRANIRSSASIAVLPFADLSPAKDQDWFCEGMAEEILNALSPLPGLRVAARASAFSFKGKSDDLRTIGEKLNVTTVLEGSVRRSGDRVRVTTQLSDAREGTQLWSERFDRDLKDIFDVQEEIARAIVARLRVTLGSDPGARLVPKATTNLEAYELMLKGRVLLSRRGRAILDAVPLIERALALDPSIADAHAMLADCYRLMAIYSLEPTEKAIPPARTAVQRALALDPRQADALATLANIVHVFDGDFKTSHVLTERALAAEPSHVRALMEGAVRIASTQQPAERMEALTLEWIARARATDPLNTWAMAIEAMCLVMMARLDEAGRAAERAIQSDPTNFTAHWARLFTLNALENDAEIEPAIAAAIEMSRRHPFILAELASVRARQGDKAAASAVYSELIERAAVSFISPALLSVCAASAGRPDEALAHITAAVDSRDAYITFWKLPAYRAFSNVPACADELRRAAYLKSEV